MFLLKLVASVILGLLCILSIISEITKRVKKLELDRLIYKRYGEFNLVAVLAFEIACFACAITILHGDYAKRLMVYLLVYPLIVGIKLYDTVVMMKANTIGRYSTLSILRIIIYTPSLLLERALFIIVFIVIQFLVYELHSVSSILFAVFCYLLIVIFIFLRSFRV